MNLQDSLPLQTNDPLELLLNQKTLTVECYRRSLALERLLLKGRDDMPLDSKKATQLFVELVAYWVKQPDFLNPAHNKVFTDFSTYNWSGDWCTSLSKQFYTLFGFKDDYELQAFLRIQGTEILHSLQDISNLLIVNQSYNQSAMVMANAIRLARSLRMHNEADALARLIAKSTAGIYTSYLQVAESAIANGQMPMAEKYLSKALDYKAKNGGEILDQISQANAFELFANACLAKAESLNTLGNYVDALQYLNKAKEYALRIGFYVNAEQLRNLLCDVHQHLYDETLMLAVTEFKNGNLLVGAEYYKNAQSMRVVNQQFIRKRNEEDSLYLSERKGFIVSSFNHAMVLLNKKQTDEAFILANRALYVADSLELISDSTVCAQLIAIGTSLFDYKISRTGSALWDYEPSKAWQHWQQADRIAVNFYLTDCEQVNEEINGYKTKIENLECLLSKKQFDTYAVKAEAHYNRQNYLVGQAFADSALNLISPNHRCIIDMRYLQMIREKFAASAKYQQMISKLEVAYSLQKPDTIDALRSKLHRFYILHQAELNTFSQPTVEWFLNSHQRIDLVDFYLQRIFKTGDYAHCIKLLDVLRINGYKVENTVEFQQDLGKAMADALKLEPDFVKIESYLDELVPDKVWFASYRQAFIDKLMPVIQQIKNKLNEMNSKGS
jgi:tetratricopeptide (TPR) repeat protein